MNKIDEFKGKYFFLSNYFSCEFEFDGIRYLNSEAAFQAQKCINKEQRKTFSHLTPDKAKSKGRHVILRNDWEKVKDQLMIEILMAKFNQCEELKQKLLLTENLYLEEGNTWGDKYWGTVNGIGKNMLGKALMKVREKLKEV